MPGVATPEVEDADLEPDEEGWDVADSGAPSADRTATAQNRNGNGTHPIVITPLDEETTIQDEDPLAAPSTDAVTLPRRKLPPPRAPSPSRSARPSPPPPSEALANEDETRKGPPPSSGPPPAPSVAHGTRSGMNGRGNGAANGNGVAVAPLDWADQESDSQTEIYVKEKRLPRATPPPRSPAPRAQQKSLSWLPPPTPPPPSKGTLPWPMPMTPGLGETRNDNPSNSPAPGSLPPPRTPPLGETRNDRPATLGNGSLPPPRTPPRSNPPPPSRTALGPLPRPSMPPRTDPIRDPSAYASEVAHASNGVGRDYGHGSDPARHDAHARAHAHAHAYGHGIPAAAPMPSLSPADWGLAEPAQPAQASAAGSAYGFDYRGRSAPGASEPPPYGAAVEPAYAASAQPAYASAAPDPYAAAHAPAGAFPAHAAPAAPVPSAAPAAASYAPSYAPPVRPATAVTPPRESTPWNRQSLALAAASLVLSVLMAVVLLVPRRGQLRIDAAVDGGGRLERAEVYVDGRKECDTVPCTVTNLSPGPKTIKLIAPDGAAPELVIENVERGEEKAVVIPVRGGGRVAGGTRLVVAAGQPGLKVSVDGADRGPAPVDLHGIAPGPHRLRFDAGPRFEPLERTVEVPAGQTLEIAAVNLKVLRGRATIDLLTPGARVILARVDSPNNAKLLPGPWPMALDLDPGWKVSATLRGFRAFEQPVTFADGTPETSMRIDLQPEGAAVAQAPIGRQTEAAPRTAAAPPTAPRVGNYQKAEAEDDEPAASEPATSGGGGTLNINSLPLSKVLLDGKPLGSTPKVGVKVSAGSHTVTFIHPELGRKSLSVTVKPGQTATASVRFNK